MANSKDPLIVTVDEDEAYLEHIEDNVHFAIISTADDRISIKDIDCVKQESKIINSNSDLILDYPVVYLHVWQDKEDHYRNRYKIYIGEAENAIRRQKEHYQAANNKASWQWEMLHAKTIDGKRSVPKLYIIGNKYFNKSTTLDIEHNLVTHCRAMKTAEVKTIATSPQRKYYGSEWTDELFGRVWKELRRINKDLFLPLSDIRKSAIYRASPNHVLTETQEKARDFILDRLDEATIHNKKEQLIMVEGEAGTGKSVLTNTAFYNILQKSEMQKEKTGTEIKAYMLINHNEQFDLCRNVIKTLGFDEELVQKPTPFLNKIDADNPVDIVFVDEAHLLWTQGRQAYTGKNQLFDIMKRAKITVVMYDEFQALKKPQYIEPAFIDQIRNISSKQGNHFVLADQMRMHCNSYTLDWIDDFSKNKKINKYQNSKDSSYEIRAFDNPKKLHDAILNKSKTSEGRQSRLIATYDWPYTAKNEFDKFGQYWGVYINYDKDKKWYLPWNRMKISKSLKEKLNINNRELKNYKDQAWHERDYTINEVGSTFTIQGFDLDYAGVILGPSIRYDKETDQIWFDKTQKFSRDQMSGLRTMADGTNKDVGDIFLRNELRVLMTRGTKGLYIYACDKNLREVLYRQIQ